MEQSNDLAETVRFIAHYASRLMGSGVHTSRMVRNSRRIGEALGVSISIAVLSKSIVVSGTDEKSRETFSIVSNIPAHPISFEWNADLSALSWEAVDCKLSLAQISEKYERLCAKPRLDPLFILICVGLANASFCRLFGGDVMSMGVVFTATLFGFFLKQRLSVMGLNHYFVFMVSAFVASLFTSVSLVFNPDSNVAMATSVLYLIPGVPLINGFIDIVEGHILTGIARLTSAVMLITCIAIGLSATLLIVKSELL